MLDRSHLNGPLTRDAPAVPGRKQAWHRVPGRHQVSGAGTNRVETVMYGRILGVSEVGLAQAAGGKRSQEC